MRCTARSKTTGKQCRRTAAPGYSVCIYHGARKHYPLTAKDLTPQEQEAKEQIMKSLLQDPIFEKTPITSTEHLLLQTALDHLIRSYRSYKGSTYEYQLKNMQFKTAAREINKILSRRIGTKISQDIHHTGTVTQNVNIYDLAKKILTGKDIDTTTPTQP